MQWDTSEHDWLEGRGEEILLINMIDDATSRWFARFVKQRLDSGKHEPAGAICEETRPAAGFLHRQGGLFQTAVKTKRDESARGKGSSGVAADADRPGLARAGNPLDSGAQSRKPKDGWSEDF